MHVSDLIDGIFKCMNSSICGPINLGNPEEFTILEVANLIKEQLNNQTKFIFKDLPQDDPTQRKP